MSWRFMRFVGKDTKTFGFRVLCKRTQDHELELYFGVFRVFDTAEGQNLA